MSLTKKAFENIVGNGENAGYQTDLALHSVQNGLFISMAGQGLTLSYVTNVRLFQTKKTLQMTILSLMKMM